MSFEQLQAVAAALGYILNAVDTGFILSRAGVSERFATPGEVEQALRQIRAAGITAETTQGQIVPPRTAPQAGGYRPKPSRWDELMPNVDYDALWEPVLDRDKEPTGQFRETPAYFSQIREYESRIEAEQTAKTKAEEKKAKAKALAAAQPETIEYNGERFWRPNPNAPWHRIGKAGQTLDQALEEAITAKNPDWAEVDRLIAARNKIETTDPGYLQKERAAEETRRQNKIKNQQDQAKIALDVQKQAIALAQSPGDWLAWWTMVRPDIQTTEQQFQQFGADRFLGQPPGAAPGAAQQQGVPTQATVAGTPAAASIFAPPPSTAGDQPGAAPFVGGLGTGNPAIYAELARRRREGTNRSNFAPSPTEQPGQDMFGPQAYTSPETGWTLYPDGHWEPPGSEANTVKFGTPPAAQPATTVQTGTPPGQSVQGRQNSLQQAIQTQPGLDFLRVIFAGQQPQRNRQIPSIPGAPPFPSQQTLNNLLPSQQQAFTTAVASTGTPLQDYLAQLRATYNTQPAPRLRLQPRGV